jgi:glycosyltransferase involved in cell wall biosynthesis
MKILFVANLNSVLIYQLADGLKPYFNQPFDLLGIFEGKRLKDPGLKDFHPVPLKKSRILRNLNFLTGVVKSLFILLKMKRVEVINIHYINPYYAFFMPFFKMKSRRIVATIYGSDFYLTNSFHQKLRFYIYKYAQTITFSNEGMAKDFKQQYPSYAGKVTRCRFGLGNLKRIDVLHDRQKARRLVGLPESRLIVSLGHSANIRERQKEMIQLIGKMDPVIKEKLHLVLPFTYNAIPSFVQQIKKTLDTAGVSYQILLDYLSDQQIAAYRKATDILLSLPSSDQLTASMLETLYAGNIVITGNWLPYEILDQNGIQYIKLDELNQMPEALSKVIKSIELEKPYLNLNNNKAVIETLFGWDSVAKDWINAFSTSLPKKSHPDK